MPSDDENSSAASPAFGWRLQRLPSIWSASLIGPAALTPGRPVYASIDHEGAIQGGRLSQAPRAALFVSARTTRQR